MWIIRNSTLLLDFSNSITCEQILRKSELTSHLWWSAVMLLTPSTLWDYTIFSCWRVDPIVERIRHEVPKLKVNVTLCGFGDICSGYHIKWTWYGVSDITERSLFYTYQKMLHPQLTSIHS